jgi:hypothetical protein
MGDALPGEEVGQGAVLRVDPGVVGLQSSGLDPWERKKAIARSTNPTTVGPRSSRCSSV